MQPERQGLKNVQGNQVKLVDEIKCAHREQWRCETFLYFLMLLAV